MKGSGIHLNEYTVTRDDRRVTLAPKEFDLLAYLVCNAGRAFTPQELYASVWGNRFGDLSTVTDHLAVTVLLARAAVAQEAMLTVRAQRPLIETVRHASATAPPPPR